MRRHAAPCRLAAFNRHIGHNQKEEPTMVKLTLRYARYVPASLASVGFGISIN
jgi:hypothetical protein